MALLLVLLAALPTHGILVPNRSLGGIQLGEPEADVRAAWGPRVGVCRNCRDRTLYFTYRAFAPEGAAAVFHRRRAVALFTLWSPRGWRTAQGLRLGDPAARITRVYGPLPRVECGGYYALTLPRGRSVTTFYVLRERVWAFGLMRKGQPLCR